MRLIWAGLIWVIWAAAPRAHVAEQGFVLLLPTDVYIGAGTASVALTVILLIILPKRWGRACFRPFTLVALPRLPVRHLTSLLSALGLVALIAAGLFGARDPLANPLPLFVWVVWWMAALSLQGLIWDHWRWTNPWTGPAAFLARVTGARAPLRYPSWLGVAPGLIGFLAFAGFLLADPAPTDPGRLSAIVGAYWLANLGAVLLFGPRWLLCADAVSMLMRLLGRMAMIGRHRGRLALGLPGWQVLMRRSLPSGSGLLALILLGSGSFDGLNETFWWLTLIGVNPLEFPGRSAVITPTLVGLLVTNTALLLAFFASIRLGLMLSGSGVPLREALRTFAPSVLPIALGYHIGHYLTSFLVDGQFVIKAARAALGLEDIRVTAGFLNTPGTVKVIWLTQAGAVVTGHVVAILVAHALALRLFGGTRRAVLSQVPLAIFMIAYTFFGLWLLASPRGM